MSDHPTNDDQRPPSPDPKPPDPEAPDPAGNPAEHTSPRENQEIDPERLERGREEQDRTIAT